jgi:bifunctional non-homologous end joining protein LigD
MQAIGRMTCDAERAKLREDNRARTKVPRIRKIVLPDISKLPGAKKGLLPAFLAPSLASLTDRPPSGPKWVHEIKYDGYRMQARIDGPNIRLLTRKSLDWTKRFRNISEALKKLRIGSALLDGEIVVEDANGVSSFNDLVGDLKAGRQDRFQYHVFDLLYCDGFDLTQASLIDRKGLLHKLLSRLSAVSAIRFSEHLEEDGPTMFEHACRLGLEGIVSKRRDLPYRPGRGEHWLKSKCVERQEFVILGYVPSTAASGSVGSIPLGYYDGEKLIYAGRVGTGWSAGQARSLRNDIEKIHSVKPNFGKKLPAAADKGVRWAEPRLVCVIEYRGWTHDGLLRAPSFKGLREDKAAEDIVLEKKTKPHTA